MSAYSNVSRETRNLDLVVHIMTWMVIILTIFFAMVSFASARLIINGEVYTPTGIGTVINGTANLSDYYNKTEVNALLQNLSLNLTNTTVYINTTNNITTYIVNNNTYYVNTTNNITYVQVYNDSALQQLISAVNSSALHNSGDQVLNGGLTVMGNFAVVGQYVNLTVSNQFMNGSIIPELNGIFDIGSPSMQFQNVYAVNVYGNVNASQIINPYWLTSSDLNNYYNKSEIDGLIAGVNQTTYVTNNITTYVNTTNNITNYVENNNTIINNITNYINTTEYVTNNITTYINETYNDSMLLAMFGNFYNKTEIDLLLQNVSVKKMRI